MFLESKLSDTLGIIFVILVIIGAFGIAIWQVLKMKKEKRLAEEHKKQMKALKLTRKNKVK